MKFFVLLNIVDNILVDTNKTRKVGTKKPPSLTLVFHKSTLGGLYKSRRILDIKCQVLGIKYSELAPND